MGTRGTWSVIGKLRQYLTFRHHGGGGTNFILFINSAVDDLHILQIFLHDLFARQFDVLLGLMPCSFADPINHMFLDQHTDLLGQISPGRQLRYTLADRSPLGEVALALADPILIGGIANLGCWSHGEHEPPTKPEAYANGTDSYVLLQQYHLSDFHPAPQRTEFPDNAGQAAAPLGDPLMVELEAIALLRHSIGLLGPSADDHPEAVLKVPDKWSH